MKKINNNLYEHNISEYNWTDIDEWFESGSASEVEFKGFSITRDTLTGRRLDVGESSAVHIVHCDKSGIYKSVAIAGIGWNDELSELDEKMLPFTVLDGINEKGLCVSVHPVNTSVLAGDNIREHQTINPGAEKTCHIDYLARWILDNYESVEDMISGLEEVEITSSEDKDFFGYYTRGEEPHYHVSDGTRTVVIEFVGDHIEYSDGSFIDNNYYFNSVDNQFLIDTVINKPIMMRFLKDYQEEELSNQYSVVYDLDSFSLILEVHNHYSRFYRFGLSEQITGEFLEREFRIQFELETKLPEELRKHGFNDFEAYINDFLDFDRYKFDTELFYNFGSYYIQPLTNESNVANFTFDIFMAFRGDTGDNLHEKMLAYADSVFNVFRESGYNFNGAVDGQVNTEVYFYNAAEGNVNMKVCAITFTTSSEY